MLSDLEFVLVNLRDLQTSKHREAEEQLKHSCQTDPEITRTLLLRVLVSDHNDSIKMAAASYLNSLLITETDESPQNYPRVAEALVQLLANPQISGRCKPSLQRSLTGIIDATSNSTTATYAETSEWISFTKRLFASGLANPAGYMVMEAYATANMNESYFFEFLNDIVPISLTELSSASKQPSDIKEWTVVFYQLFERLEETDTSHPSLVSKQLLQDFCNDQLITQLIFAVYTLKAQPPILIVADYELNSLKAEVASLHLLMLEYLCRNNCFNEYGGIHLTLLETCLPLFSGTLQVVSAAPLDLDLDMKASEFLVSILTMFKLAVKLHRFTQRINESSRQLLTQVFIPLLRVTPDDLNTFETDPQEFCTYADDIIDRQNSKTVKSQAAAVVEAFLDQVDGCASFAFDMAIQSMLVHMEQPTEPPALLLSYSQCFLVLGLLSCQYTYKRKDLLQKLRDFFQAHGQVIQRLNPVEMTWYYLFMGYNFIDIFPKAIDGERFILQASNYKGHPTTGHAALDFLSNITDKYYSDTLFKSTCDKATTCSSMHLWDAYIVYVTQKFECVSEEGMLYLVGKLFQRIQQDLERIAQKQSKDLMFVMKSLSVLRGLAINVVYLKTKPHLQEGLWRVVQLLDHPKRMELANEVLNIVMMLLSYNKHALGRQLELLQRLSDVQINLRYRNIFQPCYRILNLYINKMAPLQNQHTRLLFQMCLQTLTPRLHDTREHDVAQGLLLLQLFVKKFESVICVEQTKALLKKMSQLKLKHPISYCRVMVLTVLLYPIELQQKLSTGNAFIQQLLQHQEMFATQYERKMLVMALCQAMLVETDMLSLAEMINVSVRILTRYIDTAHNLQPTPSEDKEYELSVQKLKCDWNRLDIYAYFRERLQALQKSNPVLYDQIMQSLTREVQLQLHDIKATVTVGSQPRKILKVNVTQQRPEAAFTQDYEHALHEKAVLEEEDSQNRQFSDIEEDNQDGRMKKRKL